MSLRDTTRAIIALVEQTSGFPVIVTEDPNQRALTVAHMARGDASAHSITYNPSAGTAPDYLIAYQCGFVLRHFAIPLDDRFDFGPSRTGREEVGRLLAVPGGPAEKLKLSPAATDGLRDQLFDGLMLQLRSIPIGMRVDAWILNSYPVLLPLQRIAALQQLQENQAALAPSIRMIAPKEVYDASVSMNAAFAAYWARTFNEPALVVPYRAAGYLTAGEALLNLLDKTPDSPLSDRTLMDSWGEYLNLTPWYAWLPYVSGNIGGK